MAEDTNKLGKNNEDESTELNETENKDWQWDAAAPLAQEDFLELNTLESSEDEKASQKTVTKKEKVIESPVEEKEADEPKAEAETKVEPGYCIICGEKIRRSESELYCNECRQKYMKVDYGASHIILSIIMIFVTVIAIVGFFSTSKIAKAIIEGNNYFDQQMYAEGQKSYFNAAVASKELNDNFNAFLHGISTNFEDVTLFDAGESYMGNQIKQKARSMTVSYEQRAEFFEMVDKYLSEKELNSKEYADVKACYDFCKKLDNTVNDISNVWLPYMEKIQTSVDEQGKPTGEAPTAEEVFAAIDKYKASHPNAEPSIMEYMKFNTLVYIDVYVDKIDRKEALKYLKTAHDKAGKFGYVYNEQYLTYAWESNIYDEIVPLCAELRKLDPSNSNAYFYESRVLIINKKYDAALKLCNDLKKYCPNDLSAYIIQSEILRIRKDYDAALDVLQQAKVSSDDSEIFRQESIVYMLNGEKEKALKAATETYTRAYAAAYSGENVSLESLNTAALVCKLCNDDKTYAEIESLLSSEGIKFMQSVTEIINGEKTFEDVFLSGKGDL